MVSEKIVVALLIVAILLSVFSVILTVSIDADSIRNIPMPSVKPKTNDQQTGQVGIIVIPPLSVP